MSPFLLCLQCMIIYYFFLEKEWKHICQAHPLIRGRARGHIPTKGQNVSLPIKQASSIQAIKSAWECIKFMIQTLLIGKKEFHDLESSDRHKLKNEKSRGQAKREREEFLGERERGRKKIHDLDLGVWMIGMEFVSVFHMLLETFSKRYCLTHVPPFFF